MEWLRSWFRQNPTSSIPSQSHFCDSHHTPADAETQQNLGTKRPTSQWVLQKLQTAQPTHLVADTAVVARLRCVFRQRPLESRLFPSLLKKSTLNVKNGLEDRIIGCQHIIRIKNLQILVKKCFIPFLTKLRMSFPFHHRKHVSLAIPFTCTWLGVGTKQQTEILTTKIKR